MSRGGIVPWIGCFACILGCTSGLVTPAHAVVDVRGFVSAGATQTNAPSSWRSGDGFGILDLGNDLVGNDAEEARLDLQVVVDARKPVGSRTTLGAFLHVLGRAEPSSVNGQEAGIVEAYVESQWLLRDADLLRLQFGHFILPTSRENVSWAWSSPYTLTFSALNTWIGEEVRATGLSLEHRIAVGARDQLRWGATAFGSNDSSGTLLAWRGWAMSDRLTVWDEVTPLPPGPGLEPGGAFDRQRDDGSLPFGEDLDDEVGYAGWLGWSRGEQAFLQVSWYDNRADRGLHMSGPGYEYAWRTEFWHTAAELNLGRWTLASEWMSGNSGMGFDRFPHVDIEFEAAYLMASVLTDPWLDGTWRFTARWDEFDTTDTDLIAPALRDDNDSEGDAVTLALFWEWTRRPLRFGLEYLNVDATRPQALDAGFGADVGGEQVRIELRWFFGQ